MRGCLIIWRRVSRFWRGDGVRQRVFLWGGADVFEGLIWGFLKRYRQ